MKEGNILRRMILYFSATGNSRCVASRIASSLGEEAHSIETYTGDITLKSGEVFGLVTPTYSWELPINVREYLEKMPLTASPDIYSFVVATYGTTPGAAGFNARKILKKKGIRHCALYSIRMPDTWTPIFNLSDKDRVNKILLSSDKEIDGVIECIKTGKRGNMMKRSVPCVPRYLTDIFYNRMRRTNHLSVNTDCIGCSLCAKRCPAGAIRMENKKPVWIKSECVMCLRCLHHCPKTAIEYDNKTRKHGQYHHPEE